MHDKHFEKKISGLKKCLITNLIFVSLLISLYQWKKKIISHALPCKKLLWTVSLIFSTYKNICVCKKENTFNYTNVKNIKGFNILFWLNIAICVLKKSQSLQNHSVTK